MQGDGERFQTLPSPPWGTRGRGEDGGSPALAGAAEGCSSPLPAAGTARLTVPHLQLGSVVSGT